MNYNYKINWTQPYKRWDPSDPYASYAVAHAEKLLELRTELSGLKEAREVLARIMAL
jgi:hypothetical protein